MTSYKKILEQRITACIYNFIIIHRSSLRTFEAKAVSFYMIHNVLHETKVAGIGKLFKARVKIKIVTKGNCTNDLKKYIISDKTSIGYGT